MQGFKDFTSIYEGIEWKRLEHSKLVKTPSRGETFLKKIKNGDYVVVLGGDNYRIGMGGSSVSSLNTGELKNNIEFY